MNWNIHQTITIGQLRIDGVTNSSVLQIGSAGSIQALSQLYNTGGFTGPAPELDELGEASSALSLVPLPNPT
ncbi:spore germination protein GerPB [Cohnella cholangitidis]|uniref:Spore gernimation protein n=1 Tax=Cohnella cholangitidis TaxID=2598458 RepID=A0A7G5C4T5_9BACL|nr:spore germination protein GerPB [Cohnella cholangitidis]QMV44219.1 spore gernimation protein [Cohnella cholangitidis]